MKTIKVKQCTILWHVVDLKMSHVDSDIFFSVLDDVDIEYGKIAKMTIIWGKIHRYLRMTTNYSFTGKVILSMVDYIEKMIDDIP